MNLENVNKVLDKIEDKPIAVISVIGPKTNRKIISFGILSKTFTVGRERKLLRKSALESICFEKRFRENNNWNTFDGQPFYMNINGTETAIILMNSQRTFDDKTTYHVRRFEKF